jgi:sugar transferase EpsL
MRMKRIMDITVSLIGLIVLSPVLLVIAGVIWATMGRPIFFTQMRPGKDGKPFKIIKFRSMAEAGLEPVSSADPSADALRLTRVGRFLRSASLDELPELLNILNGDMSLVGPRPLLMEYLPLYSPAQARRHLVRPGLTGWAQVNGRNALSWEEKLAHDVWYVEHRTFWLDLRILFRTFIHVLWRKGISQPGHATAEPFRGSSRETQGRVDR